MDDKKRRLRTGLFVAGGLILVLAVLFFLGGRDLFAHKITLYTTFNESVQGLSRGSAVKFRGAPIGTVSDISIHFAENQVQVVMEIDAANFGEEEEELQGKLLRAVLEKGLRCRLEHQGITGLKYIDFDYFVDAETSAPQSAALGLKDRPNAIEIPSVPSTLKDVLGTITRSLERLGRIDIEGIGEDLGKTIREISDLIADPAIKSAINRINDAAANIESSSQAINRVFDEERMEQLRNSLETAFARVNELAALAHKEAAAANIPESSASFRSAAAAVIEGRRELSNTLFKLNQAIDSLRMMVEAIERDPNSLINGKKKAANP